MTESTIFNRSAVDMSELITKLINDKAVCRTAPATSGLLNITITEATLQW